PSSTGCPTEVFAGRNAAVRFPIENETDSSIPEHEALHGTGLGDRTLPNQLVMLTPTPVGLSRMRAEKAPGRTMNPVQYCQTRSLRRGHFPASWPSGEGFLRSHGQGGGIRTPDLVRPRHAL